MATKTKVKTAAKKASPETVETKKVKTGTKTKATKLVSEDTPKVSKKAKIIPENVSGKNLKKDKVRGKVTKKAKETKATKSLGTDSKYKYPEGMDSIERKTFRSKARAAVRKFEKRLEEATSPKDKKAIKAEYDAFKAETFA